MLTKEQNRAAVAITGVTHTDPPGNMRHLDTALAVIAHTALTPCRICELRSSHQSHPLPDGCSTQSLKVAIPAGASCHQNESEEGSWQSEPQPG